MKKILVTGGCGFILSTFIDHMLKKYPDYSIVNLDALTYAGRLENTERFSKNPRYTFIKGDVCDRVIVKKAMEGADMVVHGAAETHVDRSIVDAGSFVRTDVLGTYVMLDAARQQGVGKFLYVSTDEVYGQIQDGSFRETHPLKPRNPYSAAKAGADLLCQSYFTTHNMPVVITRSSNNFGPYQFPEKLIPVLILNALHNRPLPIYGKGENVRDWIYVADNCEAIDTVLHQGRLGEVYNIGGGNEKPNIEIAKLVLEIMGKPESLIEFVKDRPGHDMRYSLDSGKVAGLGWKPEHSFEDAIRRTVEWYVKNENWWSPIWIRRTG